LICRLAANLVAARECAVAYSIRRSYGGDGFAVRQSNPTRVPQRGWI